jgi:hypothetical protein
MIQLTKNLYLARNPDHPDYAWITLKDGKFDLSYDDIQEGIRISRERGYYEDATKGQKLSAFGDSMLKLLQ